jgi:Domain of unknown function (DUF1905)/Bacteriocin-protection, YdeI or OmpD-Associated
VTTQTFLTKLERGKTKNVTGIVVPARVVEALGQGKRPAVTVTLNGYTYRSTVASMGGRFMIGVSAEHREAAGLAGNEELEVRLALDLKPRVTPTPKDLRAALVRSKRLEAFDALAPSRRKECVRQVESAKTTETRERRIVKIVEGLSVR